MRRVWFLFLSFLPFLTSKSDDHEYYQIRSNKYSLDTLPFSSLTSAIMDQNGHCFVGLSQENIIWTSRENYLINRTIEVLGNLYTPWFKLLDINDIPTEEYQNYLLIKAADTIIILSTSNIVEFSMNYFCNEVVFYEYRYKGDRNSAWGHVFSSTVSLNTLWMGTATGLYKVDMVSSSLWNPQLVESIPISPPVTSLLWVESWSLLFAGTQSVFYEMSTEASGPIYYEWIGGNLDSEVVSMHYDNFQDCLWVAERNAVHKRDANKLWWRYGFKQGAITDNIISIASMYLPSLENEDDFVGYLWIATETHGLTRMTISANDQADRWDTWQLFYGPRYLLGQNISFIVSDTQSTQSSPFLSKFNKREETSSLLVNTNNGLSFLHSEPWSLSKKESLLQSFQYPRHDRNGIVAEVSLDSYGDLTTYYHVPEDSDGIWTSQYAVSAAFRYSLRFLNIFHT